MKDREKRLSSNQKIALSFLVSAISQMPYEEPNLYINKKSLANEFNLNDRELNEVLAIIVLALHYASKKNGGKGISRPQIRRYCSILINNPPGTRQIREEKEGKFHIPSGHSPTGRNHKGFVKARGLF